MKNTMKKILALCLAVLLLTGCAAPAAQETTEPTIPPTTEAAVKELSVTDLLKAVFTVKGDLERAVEKIEENSLEEAETLAQGLFGKTAIIRQSLDASIQNLSSERASLIAQLENIQGILDLVDLAAEKLLLPAIAQLRENPLEDMTSDEGFRTNQICEYIDFAEGLMPDIGEIIQLANTLDISIVDDDGELAEGLQAANEWLAFYGEDPAVFTRLKTMLGADGDRLYLVAAQNSSEIRASGGFPGSMGLIRIQDGVLTLEDFKGVKSVISLKNTPSAAKITSKESTLFYRMYLPWDSDFCPDHERAALIWALSYKERWNKRVDGVISLTPHVVQKVLGVLDEEILLFDGLVLNSRNATRVLQYDVYYKYFGSEHVPNANAVSNQVFADAASKAMRLVMDNMDVSTLAEYLSIAKDCVEDRTLMLWMADEGEQQIMRQLGCHGGLNKDPQKPQAGVYYSLTVASKMGWFLEMDTEMGEGMENADGSWTYPVTVTFRNIATKEEIQNASAYITGGIGGRIGGSAYFFAPAGGTVSDFVTGEGIKLTMNDYQELQLGHIRYFEIKPGEEVTVTYNLTTAPGVDVKPEFSKTPTLQAYHE